MIGYIRDGEPFLHHEIWAAEAVWADMWGYPKPNIKYPCKLLLTHSVHGEYVAIRMEIEPDCGNPFFHEDYIEWLFRQPIEEGKIYWWEGYYIKFKNGHYRFTGKFKMVEI